MEIDRLVGIRLFAGLTAEELDALASVAVEIDVPEGEAVTVEGDFGHAVLAVVSGTADVVVDDATVSTVGPGDTVGEIAVLASGRRTASVVATSQMRLISIFKRDVWALDRTAPEAARRLRELLEEHHRQIVS